MVFEYKSVDLTANGSGAATGTLTQCFGKLYEVIVVPGSGLTASWDLAITRTDAQEASAEALYTNTALSETATTCHYPRKQVVTSTAGAVTAASNENVCGICLGGLTFTGAAMGAAATATVYVIIER